MSIARPEILAPAGGWLQLEAAVRAGADAVYLGAGGMNARASAENFAGERLAEAVSYCHERGVKVHLTMNTLVFDDEMDEARRLFEYACAVGVDAIIVQDIGLASAMREAAPDMPLHASTQTSVHSPSALTTLSKLGFTRAVLARELSREELKELCAGSPVELECFVHGALCMCVSGQCLMSAMLGSRSGNRGRCAQPCRLPFHAGKREYCLSLKDNSLLDHVSEMADMGVCSLKIEGRMKRPEYCAAATAACRLAVDSAVPAELRQNLEAVFSRSGFTDGYYTGERGEPMFGFRTKDDVTAADSGVMASLHALYKNEYKRVPVSMELSCSEGRCLLSVSDGENTCASECPAGTGEAVTTAERAVQQLEKTGGTPYIAAAECAGDIPVPVSAVNALRRDALDKLSADRRTPKSVSCDWKEKETRRHTPSGKQSIHAVLRSVRQLPDSIPDSVVRIYLPLESGEDALVESAARLRDMGIEPAVEVQRGIFGQEGRIRKMLAGACKAGIETCMIHNLGLIEPAADAGMRTVGGFGLNITNTRSVETLEHLGLSECELSLELTLARAAALGGSMPRGVTVYGYLPLMLTRNCPAKLSGRCGSNGGCRITDRLGKDFPVMCRGGCSEVFNTIPLSIVEKIPEIGFVDSILLRFTVESPVETAEIMAYAASENPVRNNGSGITRGLYYRGVE